MNATLEIDKSGRLVVPKKMRDALHLRAGDKLEAELDGERLTLAPKRAARGLYEQDGWLVYDSGISFTTDEMLDWIQQDREARIAHISGLGKRDR